jgi:hypothetical protein
VHATVIPGLKCEAWGAHSVYPLPRVFGGNTLFSVSWRQCSSVRSYVFNHLEPKILKTKNLWDPPPIAWLLRKASCSFPAILDSLCAKGWKLYANRARGFFAPGFQSLNLPDIRIETLRQAQGRLWHTRLWAELRWVKTTRLTAAWTAYRILIAK